MDRTTRGDQGTFLKGTVNFWVVNQYIKMTPLQYHILCSNLMGVNGTASVFFNIQARTCIEYLVSWVALNLVELFGLLHGTSINVLGMTS